MAYFPIPFYISMPNDKSPTSLISNLLTKHLITAIL